MGMLKASRRVACVLEGRDGEGGFCAVVSQGVFVVGVEDQQEAECQQRRNLDPVFALVRVLLL